MSNLIHGVSKLCCRQCYLKECVVSTADVNKSRGVCYGGSCQAFIAHALPGKDTPKNCGLYVSQLTSPQVVLINTGERVVIGACSSAVQGVLTITKQRWVVTKITLLVAGQEFVKRKRGWQLDLMSIFNI